jgi:hypothetical protein
MAERSAYQQKLIKRYYDRRDEILLTRLGELIGELYLVDSGRKADQLWQRVDKALVGLKVAATLRNHLVSTRDVEALARNVRNWLDEAKRP